MKKKSNQQQLTQNIEHRTVVVVANGKFPEHLIPLKTLTEADIIVCCDGATMNVDRYGLIPTAIVGDLDSLGDNLKEKYCDRLFHNPDQDSNDLSKAIQWCLKRKYFEITIVGATGLREDHSLGNISLLPNYAKLGINVRMLTDTGYFIPVLHSSKIDSHKGQQVSIFSPNNLTLITSSNLKYSINSKALNEFWMGTLNESIDSWFEVDFQLGPIIIFMTYKELSNT